MNQYWIHSFTESKARKDITRAIPVSRSEGFMMKRIYSDLKKDVLIIHKERKIK